MRTRLMYIERKTGKSEAFIGRVTFSKSGKTLYYRDKAFVSIGDGNYGNYLGVDKEEYIKASNAKLSETIGPRYESNNDIYWISGPKRNGQDRLFGRFPIVKIDEDARIEYWLGIRKQPENVKKESY